ncbi:chemotaxis protein CheW [Paenibacillus sophorae]|uniref:Chemotaxis protein CheW n=1 Tax=Paenibacillus sophorae TaxID=1333845 RepID=A0ABX8HJ58_9BACL|nr:chemotaxis protein CheW [Paenibacillus sophorae]
MDTLQGEQFIELSVGSETCALRIKDIHEIIRMQGVTEIPFSKPAVKGVINLRGGIVPVMSLRNLLGMPDESFTKTTRIIIICRHEELIGLIVDKVNHITTYEEIHSPLSAAYEESSHGVFQGIASRGEQLIGILKLEGLLGS